MNQSPLFTAHGSGFRYARRSDPETSHAAAAKVEQFRATHEGRIFGALIDAGVRGATAKDIARATGLNDVQVNRRLGDMRTRGLVRHTGERRDDCMVYERTAK